MDGLTITHHPRGAGAGEYVAHVPGSDHVGRLTWVERATPSGEQARIADHTLVPPAIGGRGVAAKLVEALVADAREQGFKVVPACSYVAVAFRRHPEWSDLLA